MRRTNRPRHKTTSVGLPALESAMLEYMAKQEDRTQGAIIRIAIREAAKARGLTPEMFEQAQEA